jgi:hypothetical protein
MAGDIDNDFAAGAAFVHQLVSIVDRRKIEMTWMELGPDLVGLGKPRRLAKNIAVMRSSFSAEHRKQREHT